ncbi:MAG: type II toxin-antitoxin system VapC family toxin [Formivibrio sp.]|nr:type II toxin-antitoxin system VapC family toxin [Formivibrio sp.]
MVEAASDPARLPHLLLDTHVLVWLMFGEAKLGKKTAKAINLAARGNRLVVSAITPWEIGVLVAKKRIDLHQDAMQWVRTAISLPGMKLSALEPEIAVASTCLPFEMHADPADRILVATARYLGATLVTADHALLDLAGSGHFRAADAAR